MTTGQGSPHQQLSRRIGGVEDQLRQIQRELTSLENSLGRGFQELARATDGVAEEVVRSTEMAGRQQIALQEAQLVALGPVLQNQRDILVQELERASTNMERVISKYDEMDEELRASFQLDIRRLATEIYDLVENDYQKGIEGRIGIAPHEVLSDLVTDVEVGRRTVIRRTFDSLAEVINSFTRRRATFYEGVAELLTSIPATQPTDINIPFWVVTLETETGEEETAVYGPSTVDGWRITSEEEPFISVAGEMRSRLDASTSGAAPMKQLSGQELTPILDSLDKMGDGTHHRAESKVIAKISSDLTENPPRAIVTEVN